MPSGRTIFCTPVLFCIAAITAATAVSAPIDLSKPPYSDLLPQPHYESASVPQTEYDAEISAQLQKSGLSAEKIAKAADLPAKENPVAEACLGWKYQTGNGITSDHAAAGKWLKKSAEAGLPLGEFLYAIQLGFRQAPEPKTDAVNWMQKAAAGGLPMACNEIGLAYLDGYGLKNDAKTALGWLKKAAEGGSAYGKNNLGYCLMNGLGREMAREDAAALWRPLAEAGVPVAEMNLGTAYLSGHGVTEDNTEGFQWVLKSAQAGHVMAQYFAGLLLMYGDKGVAIDKAEAVRWIQSAAKGGSAQAECLVGMLAVSGREVPQDIATGTKWLLRAADHGIPTASFILGALYHSGDGVPVDDTKAVSHLEKAATLGLKEAQTLLGNLLIVGSKTLLKRPADGVAWLRKAVAQNDSGAECSLGMLSLRGEIVEKDEAAAVKLFTSARAQKNVNSYYPLAQCYEYGWGTAPLLPSALECYQLAAQVGSIEAIFHLGRMYYLGEGVPAEKERGIQMIREAAAKGSLSARVAARMLDSIGDLTALLTQLTTDPFASTSPLRQAAAKGDGNAQCLLACVVRERNPGESNRLIQQSAAQGNLVAMEFLRNLNQQLQTQQALARQADAGNTKATEIKALMDLLLGDPKSGENAKASLTRLAESGNAEAQVALGSFYGGLLDNKIHDANAAEHFLRMPAAQQSLRGQILLAHFLMHAQRGAEEEAQAIEILQKGARAGDGGSATELARYYLNPKNGTPSPGEAIKWLTFAAERHAPEAELFLGLMLVHGNGIQPNPAEGAQWLAKAASHGSPLAATELAICLADGNGVTKDLVAAYKWFLVAKAAGAQGMDGALQKAGAMMTPADIKSAEEQARAFRPEAQNAPQW